MSLTPGDYYSRANTIAAENRIEDYHINADLELEPLKSPRRLSIRGLLGKPQPTSPFKDVRVRYEECYQALAKLTDLEAEYETMLSKLDISPESANLRITLDENMAVVRVARRRIQREQSRLVNEAPGVQGLFTQAMLHKDRLVSYITEELGIRCPIWDELEKLDPGQLAHKLEENDQELLFRFPAKLQEDARLVIRAGNLFAKVSEETKDIDPHILAKNAEAARNAFLSSLLKFEHKELKSKLEEGSLLEIYSLMKKRLLPLNEDNTFPALNEYFIQAVDDYEQAREKVEVLWLKAASTPLPLPPHEQTEKPDSSTQGHERPPRPPPWLTGKE